MARSAPATYRQASRHAIVNSETHDLSSHWSGEMDLTKQVEERVKERAGAEP
jgi:hypothetical protein